MASVPYTSFLPEVLPKVPSCADVVAINAVRNAAVEFCTRTLAWNEAQDPVTVDYTEFPLSFDAPSGARVCEVLSATFGSHPLRTVTQDELDAYGSDWRTLTGVPSMYFLPSTDTLSTYPLPGTAGNLLLRVAYAPTRSSTNIDSSSYELYLEGIAAGALARLLREPGQAYSNPPLAEYYDTQFEREVTGAKIKVNKSLTRGDVVVSQRRFA